jgi:hypothetical protein
MASLHKFKPVDCNVLQNTEWFIRLHLSLDIAVMGHYLPLQQFNAQALEIVSCYLCMFEIEFLIRIIVHFEIIIETNVFTPRTWKQRTN